MPLDQTVIINQIDGLIERFNRLKGRAKYDDFSDLPEEEINEAVNLLFAAIERLAPPGSSYAKSAKAHDPIRGGNVGIALAPLVGILKALRTDYRAGNMQSVVELVHADIFADFRNGGSPAPAGI